MDAVYCCSSCVMCWLLVTASLDTYLPSGPGSRKRSACDLVYFSIILWLVPVYSYAACLFRPAFVILCACVCSRPVTSFLALWDRILLVLYRHSLPVCCSGIACLTNSCVTMYCLLSSLRCRVASLCFSLGARSARVNAGR